MGEVSTIGLDIAKSVFQVHGVDSEGAMVIRKRISRAKVLEFFAALPSCLVGIEACPSARSQVARSQVARSQVARSQGETIASMIYEGDCERAGSAPSRIRI